MKVVLGNFNQNYVSTKAKPANTKVQTLIGKNLELLTGDFVDIKANKKTIQAIVHDKKGHVNGGYFHNNNIQFSDYFKLKEFLPWANEEGYEFMKEFVRVVFS